MTWLSKDRRLIVYLISFALAAIGAGYSVNQSHHDTLVHNQNQQVVLYDMKLLLDNQKIMVENVKAIRDNGTFAQLRDLRQDFVTKYNESLNVNPLTGLPS